MKIRPLILMLVFSLNAVMYAVAQSSDKTYACLQTNSEVKSDPDLLPQKIGHTYYLDPVSGNDMNTGLSDTSPLKNYTARKYTGGDSVLFKRGSVIRSALSACSGTEQAPVVYGAYGKGNKPAFLGSMPANNPSGWVEEHQNLWRYTGSFPSEVCNVIFNNGESCGILRWRTADLQKTGDWYYTGIGKNSVGSENAGQSDRENFLYLCSPVNPALKYSSIECVLWGERRLASGEHHIVFENLTFRNSGVHGYQDYHPKNITIRNCEFRFIGGAVWSLTHRIRFGNAVELWDGAADITVEDCLFDNIYDSAVTHQGGGIRHIPERIYFRNNLFSNCGLSAYESREPGREVYFEYNTCINSGGGFSMQGESPPRKSNPYPQPVGYHVMIWLIEPNTQAGPIYIRHNIFYKSYGAAISAVIDSADMRKFVIDQNSYYQPAKNKVFQFCHLAKEKSWSEAIDSMVSTGKMPIHEDRYYTSKEFPLYQKERGQDKNSRIAKPRFVNENSGDYRQRKDSPCLEIGKDGEKKFQKSTTEIYVSVNGKDTNPGTLKAPLATLATAQKVTRKLIAQGLTSDLKVLLRGGTYKIPQTLTFGPEDSGTEKYGVTYSAFPGEKVILSGGQQLTGWKKSAGKIWTTTIPEVKKGSLYFQQLYINNTRAVRARTPNADGSDCWWRIAFSSATRENPPGEKEPITIKVSGQLASYSNPSDIELVYLENNECGWKRLESVDVAGQTITLATPNRWNPKEFVCDWSLSIPFAGKSCYLENAPEMLDQPGEWYLDRKTGILSYWPKEGENMEQAEAVIPVLQKTMLNVAGSPEHPVNNLHFKGLLVEHIDLARPPWGYMAMFCCNVAVTGGPKPGHRPIDAAVEFKYAHACSFSNGGISHTGGMGLCLREGTSDIVVEGNEISDLSGGGIVAGWPNAGAGYLFASPPPGPGEYSGYTISNNHIHHVGKDYFGAVGILLFPSQGAVVAHNLIHHTAYFGIGVAGSQDPNVPFSSNNLIEYNHIHDAMMTTIDGAGIYVTFGHYGDGTLLRGNVIHDTYGNPYHLKWGQHPPSAGIYLDGNSFGGIYENNLLYRNRAAGPLIFNYSGAQEKNKWVDNTFVNKGMPPDEFIEVKQALAGPELPFQKSLLKMEPNPCEFSVLSDTVVHKGWSAYQYHLTTKNRGVIQIFVHEGNADKIVQFKLNGLETKRNYKLKAYGSPVVSQKVWGPDPMPMPVKTEKLDLSSIGLAENMSGNDLFSTGLSVKLRKTPHVLWIAYDIPN